MELIDYEKAVIGTMLSHPNGTERIPERILAELGDDKFSSSQHKKIYRSISKLVLDKQIPNTLNVATQLGTDLDQSGGLEYLESLTHFPNLLGINEPKGFEPWVRLIDNAGRLRHFGLVIQEYGQLYNDFEKLIQQVRDVDEFLSNFMQKVNTSELHGRSAYRHISEAVEEDEKFLQLEQYGLIADLIPCGWPSLEKFMIPRPGSFGGIVGLSSMGKTSFALHIILGIAINLYNNKEDGVVTINSLETNARGIIRKLACVYGRINNHKLSQGKAEIKEIEKYREARDFIQRLPIFYDDNPNITTEEFSWQSIALHTHKKRVCGISDYAELFKDKNNSSEEQRIANVTRNQRVIAWELNSCEILLSQFNNEVLKSGSKIGSLSNARYSGAFEHALDWGIILWNPKQMHARGIKASMPEGKRDDMAYAFIQKNKVYPVGEIEFEWHPEYTSFRDQTLALGQLFREHTDSFDF